MVSACDLYGPVVYMPTLMYFFKSGSLFVPVLISHLCFETIWLWFNLHFKENEWSIVYGDQIVGIVTDILRQLYSNYYVYCIKYKGNKYNYWDKQLPLKITSCFSDYNSFVRNQPLPHVIHYWCCVAGSMWKTLSNGWIPHWFEWLGLTWISQCLCHVYRHPAQGSLQNKTW